MITVDTPASFEWTEESKRWVKNYLLPKTDYLANILTTPYQHFDSLNEQQFIGLCQQLETTAEGRELRNKMFKAWRSKKSRDSDNGKKLYTFNLSIEAGDQLKRIANKNPINKTLESLIFSGIEITSQQASEKSEIKQLKAENAQLKADLNKLHINEHSEDHTLFTNASVGELAKLEKSQLIKQILTLKRKLNA